MMETARAGGVAIGRPLARLLGCATGDPTCWRLARPQAPPENSSIRHADLSHRRSVNQYQHG